MKCLVCKSDRLFNLGDVGTKDYSVTSDSKLCKLKSTIFQCEVCGHIQKINCENQTNLINEIYKNYDAHYLSDGNEQLVYIDNEIPVPRSYYCLKKCTEKVDFPHTGKLLDIGCGNGAFLKTAAALLSNWQLYAYDVNNIFYEHVINMKQVVEFYSEDLNTIKEKNFNLVVLWHVLEHIDDIEAFLKKIKKLISPNGYLCIQVPDLERNPYDLAVIDHVSHFTEKTLKLALANNGFNIVLNGTDWLHNCITVLAQCVDQNNKDDLGISNDLLMTNTEPNNTISLINEKIDYLNKKIDGKKYILFGTGMASLFLLAQCETKPVFIMDEDRSKRGKKIEDIEVISPVDLNTNINIVLPFTAKTNLKIKDKLIGKYDFLNNCEFIL